MNDEMPGVDQREIALLLKALRSYSKIRNLQAEPKILKGALLLGYPSLDTKKLRTWHGEPIILVCSSYSFGKGGKKIALPADPSIAYHYQQLNSTHLLTLEARESVIMDKAIVRIEGASVFVRTKERRDECVFSELNETQLHSFRWLLSSF